MFLKLLTSYSKSKIIFMFTLKWSIITTQKFSGSKNFLKICCPVLYIRYTPFRIYNYYLSIYIVTNIAPLQGNYSEALPAQARPRRRVCGSQFTSSNGAQIILLSCITCRPTTIGLTAVLPNLCAAAHKCAARAAEGCRGGLSEIKSFQ